MCDPELFRLYFQEAVGQAAVRPELPLCPGRGVAGQPPCLDHMVVVPHYAGRCLLRCRLIELR